MTLENLPSICEQEIFIDQYTYLSWILYINPYTSHQSYCRYRIDHVDNWGYSVAVWRLEGHYQFQIEYPWFLLNSYPELRDQMIEIISKDIFCLTEENKTLNNFLCIVDNALLRLEKLRSFV